MIDLGKNEKEENWGKGEIFTTKDIILGKREGENIWYFWKIHIPTIQICGRPGYSEEVPVRPVLLQVHQEPPPSGGSHGPLAG